MLESQYSISFRKYKENEWYLKHLNLQITNHYKCF